MKRDTKKIIIGVTALVVVIAVMALLYNVFRPKPASKDTEGKTKITVTVAHKDGSVKDFDISTDSLYLRGALEQDKLVEGTESEYGLFIEIVDDEKADYSVDGSWWGIYLDANGDNKYDESEMTAYGCDSQPINDGEHYFLVYSVYSE